MEFRDDERAQAIQIGAVLLFAALVIAFSLYQAFVVPNQNEQVEADHLQTVASDMQELRNGIVTVPQTGNGRSVGISLGTNYPARVFALNPPPPSGQLRTVGTDDEAINFTLANARAIDDETADYWNGTNRTRDSGMAAYTPNYNEFADPPTLIYDSTTLFRRFDDASLWESGQTLVDGRTLTLVALDGSLDRGGSHSLAVDLEATSASTTDVAITNETGNVTVQFASMRNGSEWRSLLRDAEQFVDQGGYVVDVDGAPLPADSFDLVTIEFKPNETYTLRMAKVGIGRNTESESARYITDIVGDGASIQEGSERTLIVEARDQFNNPVSGVELDASVDNGSLANTTVVTDGDGRAAFQYLADNITGEPSQTARINVSLDGQPTSAFDPRKPGNVSMSVTVQNTDGSGLNQGTGNGAIYDVSWIDPIFVPGETGTSGESCASLPCDISMGATTIPQQPAAPFGFASTNETVVEVLNFYTAANSDGNATTAVRFGTAEGNATLWTNSGGANDSRIVSIPGYESFETDLGRYGVFGTFQGDDPELTTTNSNSGSSSVVLHGGNDGGIVTTGYNTSGAEMVIIEYWAQDNGVEANDADTGEDEDLVVEYQTSAGNWVQIDRVAAQGDAGTGENPIYMQTARVAGNALHSNFSLRFRQVAADTAGDEWLIDDPRITVVGKRVAGGEPGGRNPGGGANALTYDSGSASLSEGTKNNKDSVLSFSTTNNYGGSVEITAITINSTTVGDVVQIYNGSGDEVMIDVGSDGTTEGSADSGNGFDIGTRISLDTTATLSAGSGASITLDQFANNGDQPKDMSGGDVTVTLHYLDPNDNAQTLTIQLTNL